MAMLRVKERVYDIDWVVFDKDGTLIDFEHLWGRRTRRCVQALLARVGGDEGLRERLYRSLGYHPRGLKVLSDGPMATIPRAKLVLVAATVLYQHGLGWHEAEEHAAEVFASVFSHPPQASELRAIGDPRGLCAALRHAGVSIALLTSDDRAPTQRSLELLGIDAAIGAMVCGDDPFPAKPAADGLAHLAELLAADRRRAMLVGDSAVDMQTGRNAGVGCCVGVLSGSGDEALLRAQADEVVDSIAAIAIA